MVLQTMTMIQALSRWVPPCSVKVHAEQDKTCDISDNTSISQLESQSGSGSVQESNTRSCSPFHIYGYSSRSASSKQSVKSCSWERGEATAAF